tara:strand:+ start:2034 stop:2210 length:177 start_codon:yes stop_codon:yes gene_type:complete
LVHLRIRVPGGWIKVKSKSWLRDYEILRKVPVRRIGGLYLIWFSKDEARRRHLWLPPL